MSTTVPAEVKLTSEPAGNTWKCHVCGFVWRHEFPPEECPQCASRGREFEEISAKKQLRYDGEPFDVLIINGSSHRANNTGYMLDLV